MESNSYIVDRSLADRRDSYADEVQRLVEASFALIREAGELEPRVGAIVKRAGLSNQAFYRHFRSKDELLLLVLDSGVRLLADYLRHRMEADPDPEAQIRNWLEGVLQQALQPEAAAATRPFAVSRARLAELFPEPVRRSEAQLTALLADAIRAGVEAGRLAGARPERDAEILYSLAMGWVQQRLAQPQPPRREEADDLIAFALRGLVRS